MARAKTKKKGSYVRIKPFFLFRTVERGEACRRKSATTAAGATVRSTGHMIGSSQGCDSIHIIHIYDTRVGDGVGAFNVRGCIYRCIDNFEF